MTDDSSSVFEKIDISGINFDHGAQSVLISSMGMPTIIKEEAKDGSNGFTGFGTQTEHNVN